MSSQYKQLNLNKQFKRRLYSRKQNLNFVRRSQSEKLV
ncbi:hypothetical protein Golob_027990 [Gossypium lobatum]|uniref:Uncharacterized protein n=1 Tax=Gossypium lobatum TaxID=34289 RepID=A0A7J8NI31_9ROSI|nr:hypothetical protein [Gossypium lobatum]